MYRLFRSRFRLPYDSFLSLSEDIMDHSCFARWTRCDAVGENLQNTKLLILGCMRYIGRAWTFDDICEANGISINTNIYFLLSFIEYGSTSMYKKWVHDKNLNTDVREQEAVFRIAVFDGCIGSSDAIHIPMFKCSQWLVIFIKVVN